MEEPAIRILSPPALRARPLPSPGGDKEARGRVCVIGGSLQVPGAAMLSGEAALRAGAGKLQIATVRSAAVGMGLAVPEALVLGLNEDAQGEMRGGSAVLEDAFTECGALVIGPGMRATRFLSRLVQRAADAQGTVVLDAGALDANARAREGAPFVLTPHAGEMASMCGVDKEAVEDAPLEHAFGVARTTRSVVILKGPDSWIVAPDGEAWLHQGGASGLGTSGSGDVLAGLIGGFAARGASALDAALWGVWVHGEAGRVLGERVGSVGFLAREIAGTVPAILQRVASSDISIEIRKP